MTSEYAQDDLLPLSGIQHFLFCRRQWALIHVDNNGRKTRSLPMAEVIFTRVLSEEGAPLQTYVVDAKTGSALKTESGMQIVGWWQPQ